MGREANTEGAANFNYDGPLTHPKTNSFFAAYKEEQAGHRKNNHKD